MKFLLGVTNKNKWRLVRQGENSFWCVYRKYNVHKDDYLFLYKTVCGIVQLYRIINDAHSSEEIECLVRGMQIIDTQLIATFENPITTADMKSNPILKLSGPIGRNFQQTVFLLDRKEANEIIKVLLTKNPDMRDDLKIIVKILCDSEIIHEEDQSL